jgi:hypothetical protein
MNNPSELLIVRVEASQSLRNTLEKLLQMPGASALTRDERCELAALNLQIALAQWHHIRSKHAGSSY